MSYDLFLFDADDTLFDFGAGERDAFATTLAEFGWRESIDDLFRTYSSESLALWREVEQGKITKTFLKSERFRRTFAKHNVELPADKIGEAYLNVLSRGCVLIDHAVEICRYLSDRGRIGIITNGFELVQTRRLESSEIAPYVDFMVVSERCGYAKPDSRFFEYTAQQVEDFRKESTLVIGDRIETDIEGARAFGVDSCWFNPADKLAGSVQPTYEIAHLSELREIID